MMPPLVQDLLELNYSEQFGPIDVPLHVHHYCQADVILAGEMEMLTRGGGNGRVLLRKGIATIVPPLAMHGYRISGSVRHTTFRIRVHARYGAMLGHAPRVALLGRQIVAIAEAAGRQWRAGDPLQAQFATAAATLCLAALLGDQRSAAESSADDNTASPALSQELWGVLNEVIQHPHAGWTVQRMAQRCHLSEGHFSKTFIRAFAQTPQKFLLETRMGDAADRLNRDEDASIKSVAQATGYATVHSFSRAFKRALGVSPAAYIRSQGKL